MLTFGLPFGRVSFLFHLCENTFGLVIDAMCTSRHLSVALNLLFPTHITGLHTSAPLSTASRKASRKLPYPSYPPPLRLDTLIHQSSVA